MHPLGISAADAKRSEEHSPAGFGCRCCCCCTGAPRTIIPCRASRGLRRSSYARGSAGADRAAPAVLINRVRWVAIQRKAQAVPWGIARVGRHWCWHRGGRRGGHWSGRNRCRDRRWGGLLRSSHEQHLVGVARIQARDHVCVCVSLKSLEDLAVIKAGVSLKNQCRTSGDMRASHGSATVCCRGSVAGVPGRQNAAAWCPDVCARPIIRKRRSSILGCGRADSDG